MILGHLENESGSSCGQIYLELSDLLGVRLDMRLSRDWIGLPPPCLLPLSRISDSHFDPFLRIVPFLFAQLAQGHMMN